MSIFFKRFSKPLGSLTVFFGVAIFLTGCAQIGEYVKIDGNNNQMGYYNAGRGQPVWNNNPPVDAEIPLTIPFKSNKAEVSNPWQGFIERLSASDLSVSDKEFWLGLLSHPVANQPPVTFSMTKKDSTTTHNYINGKPEAR